MAETTISNADVMKARGQLDAMRRSLASWLKYRTLNDAVATGNAPSKLPVAFAKQLMIDGRDWATEQTIADQLYVLLSEVMPNAQLPVPAITTNPNAAVELARIAIAGPGAQVPASSPTPQGFVWLWPVLIVGGLLLAVTTAIKTMADVAKEKERLKCVQSGACTDYGFWLKVGGIAALVAVAWNQLGLKESLRSYMPRKGG